MEKKKSYKKPEMEVVEFQVEGIIATSPQGSNVGFSDEEVSGPARSKRLWED